MGEHHDVQRGKDVRTSYDEDQRDDKLREDVKETSDKATGAVQEAVNEAKHPSRDMGALADKDHIRNTLTTDPIGIITGDGLNAQYMRPIAPKVSAVGGASFGRLNAGGGTVSKFGANLGADYFLFGRYNEGLRIGPRLNLGVGRESIVDSPNTFGTFGVTGELGYNFIASNGITAGAAGGLGFVSGGEVSNENVSPGVSTGTRPDTYAKINLGYSW